MRFACTALIFLALCTASVAQDRNDGLGQAIPGKGATPDSMTKHHDGDEIDRQAPLPCDGVPTHKMNCPFRFNGSTSF